LKRFDWLDLLLGRRSRAPEPSLPQEPLRIGLALGGGFARGIAHAGVLKVFERNQIPVSTITGVSAGAIVAAAFASGATPEEIARAGCSMRFTDVAKWSICRMGFVGSERMEKFLKRLLKVFRFEDMQIPLGVVATDLSTGEPVLFRDTGDVNLPIRASCSYPGLFQPVRMGDLLLVDGAMSMEVPALVARKLGATRVISVHLPMQDQAAAPPQNMFQVVNRSFQIMQKRMEDGWRRMSDLVIVPEVSSMQWDEFTSAQKLVEAGERAAEKVLPEIRAWMAAERPVPVPVNGHRPAQIPAPAAGIAQNGNGNGNGRVSQQEDWSLKKS
jgi:NTE family protein